MRHSLYSSIVTIWVVDSCWGHPWERAEKALVRRAKPEKTIHTCVNSHSATITANTQTRDWKNLQSKRKWCSHMNVHTLACTHYCPQNHNSQFSLHLKKKKRQLTEEVEWRSKNRSQGSTLQFATPIHTPLAIMPRFISVRQSSTGNERRSHFQWWLIGIKMLHSSRQSIKSNWSELTGWSGKSTAFGPSHFFFPPMHFLLETEDT